ncbi:MAG: AbrB/MazE/SpoVT family DNA-binding domain-containing protein [Firmicutes bacterium]|nr:AbrB/MazE/SpoVT family DNA-binding domain-containing protein [Bacillota bacterium]MCL2255786.1 AbrB/MazE/SpoVT family DNA-binding domain-containing protein [Bacillota bacterium]
MKRYAGIVRRLDNLGRVVIPREYRKMHRINESDLLEITSNDSGEIIVKKLNLSDELMNVGSTYVTQLVSAIGLTTAISDTEKFLLADGELKGTLSYRLPNQIAALISSRRFYNGTGSEVGLEGVSYIAFETLYLDDVFGAIYFVSNDPISDEDARMLKPIARIFSAQMQKF